MIENERQSPCFWSSAAVLFCGVHGWIDKAQADSVYLAEACTSCREKYDKQSLLVFDSLLHMQLTILFLCHTFISTQQNF